MDYELIIEHWDDILRLVTTIKLGHEKASTLLRRLNSYSRQHPLYDALKEFGRLYKTIYILRYISQEELRKSVEAVLSKVENANHFAKAVMLGNSQEFDWNTHVAKIKSYVKSYDQLTAEGCKRLIINSINYYNLLLLSQQICNCKSVKQKEELVNHQPVPRPVLGEGRNGRFYALKRKFVHTIGRTIHVEDQSGIQSLCQ